MPDRHQQRTVRLTGQVKPAARESAGRAGTRLPTTLAVSQSRHTALCTLLRIPLPVGRVPRVTGVDDFALRRHHRHATVIINADLPHPHVFTRGLERNLDAGNAALT